LSRSNAIKGFGFVLWLLAVSAVLATLYYQDELLAIKDIPIAKLQTLDGDASARPEGSVRWSEIGVDQPFFDGDLIAVGKRSKGVIDFSKDRKLTIYSDTQVKILRIKSGDQDTFMITLIRGSLEVNNCNGCPEFILKSGDNQFRLAGGNAFGLSKEAGKKAKKVKPTLLVASIAKQEENDDEQSKVLSEDFLKEPLKISSAKGLEPKVSDRKPNGQKVNSDLWTMRSLSEMNNLAIEIPVISNRRRPKVGKMSLLARLEGKNPRRSIVYKGRGPKSQIFKIPISDIRKTANLERLRGGVMQYNFKVKGGALVRFEKETRQSFGRGNKSFSIKSYGEYPGGPVSLALSEWSRSRGQGIWMRPKTSLIPSAAPISVHLVSSTDLARFNPYFRGARKAGRSRRGLYSGNGVFVVRNSQVVAQLRGDKVNGKVRREIMNLLKGEFVFRGSRSALHDTRTRSKGDLVNWMSALLDKGKVLYILKRKKLYPVSKQFIKTNDEVAQFIDEQAKAVFLDKVEILHSR
jgi:hypothetical protein